MTTGPTPSVTRGIWWTPSAISAAVVTTIGAGAGSDYKSDLQKAQDAVSGDTIFFKPGFGKETIEHVKLSGGEAHDVLDLSLYGTTFEALRAAGAFEQVGNDVVLTLNPADPAHSDQIILKSIELHQIDPGDFKFS